jgi:hypothetical protein
MLQYLGAAALGTNNDCFTHFPWTVICQNSSGDISYDVGNSITFLLICFLLPANYLLKNNTSQIKWLNALRLMRKILLNI